MKKSKKISHPVKSLKKFTPSSGDIQHRVKTLRTEKTKRYQRHEDLKKDGHLDGEVKK